MLRPPQTAPSDCEGTRQTVQLVPRLRSGSGDCHPATETINIGEDIGQISPRNSITSINHPLGDSPRTLYGPLGISQLSPILGAADSVLLSKSPFELKRKPLPLPPFAAYAYDLGYINPWSRETLQSSFCVCVSA